MDERSLTRARGTMPKARPTAAGSPTPRPGSANATARPGPSAPRRSRPYARGAAEAVVGAAAALGYTLMSNCVNVDPLVRLGQVSGLAALQLYAAAVGGPLLGVLVYSAHRGSPERHELVKRLVCAALSGLATGVIAGGVVVALSDTPWPLGGQNGDPGVLERMAYSFLHGEGMSGVYPPGFPALIALWAKLRYGPSGETGYALHDLQILFTALAGPMAYASWRLLLRPFWALMISVPAAVLFLDPIRPYSHVVMIMLLPLLTRFLRETARAGERPTASLVRRAAALGVTFGLLFLWYSGWYVWAAPGAAVLALLSFPWRAGPATARKAGLFAGVTAATAAVVGSPLLYQMIRLGPGTHDRYAYLSVYADPAYVLGWMSDRSGGLTYRYWPTAGEMAGQTGFALLLLLGVGLGLGLGLRDPAARMATAILAGAWPARFWIASHMAKDQAVQLYPRTTWIIMYCLMVLALAGVRAVAHRGLGWIARASADTTTSAAVRTALRRRVPQLGAGLVCALALFATMGASWSGNRYMPSSDIDSMGIDAYRAHTVQLPNGTCPRHSPVAACDEIRRKVFKPRVDRGFIWCASVPAEDWPTVCGQPAPKSVPSRATTAPVRAHTTIR